MSFEKKFMERAIELAQSNIESQKGGPFGAVIVKDGKIIGEGANRVTSQMDPTAHAEVVAIRDACKNINHYQLDGCEIYCSCEPCPMCLGAIYWSRPDKIYYAATKSDAKDTGFDDQFIYEEIDRPKSERKIPTEHHMREAAVAVFKKWLDSDFIELY